MNDIGYALDDGLDVALVLVDLSSAFDTVDHQILLERLQFKYGMSGSVLSWFKSYLSERYQITHIDKIRSSPRLLNSGVPQGSVLGPLQFPLYISPIEDIIDAHGLHSISYADDNQVYMSVRPSDKDDFTRRLERCLTDLSTWYTTNLLKCNPNETNYIYFSSKFKSNPLVPTLVFEGHELIPSDVILNLGVKLDKHLLLKDRVSDICRGASLSITRISKLRKYLDVMTTNRLTHAFVISKLDYCNSLLCGLPSRETAQLQKIQNTAARIATLTKKREHIAPILRKLHWLPIEKRIRYKTCLLVYNILIIMNFCKLI